MSVYPCSVDKGLKVNSVNYQKRTALHLAVIGRNEEVVRALLKVGASVNIQVSSTFKEYTLYDNPVFILFVVSLDRPLLWILIFVCLSLISKRSLWRFMPKSI